MPAIPSTDCTYEELGRMPEIGLKLEANTAVHLFTCAAQAMFHLIHPATTPLSKVSSAADAAADWRQISLSAEDPESLLVAWLSELLRLHATTGLIFHRYNMMTWEPTFIEATVTGDEPEQPAARRIRAVTTHQLDVTRTTDNWQARIFFEVNIEK